MKAILNVGGNNANIGLPSQYSDFKHVLLDIDPSGNPDIVADARQLGRLKPSQYDVVYCSHNLEHYYHHEIDSVLKGFLHVIKPGGLAHIRVPDIPQVMKTTLDRNLDLADTLYQSKAGPITVRDVLYGYGLQIEKSGEDFYAHKTGFSNRSLTLALKNSGFSLIFMTNINLEIQALAFKGKPSQDLLRLWQLPVINQKTEKNL